MRIIKTVDFRTDEPLTIYECDWCNNRFRSREECHTCEINCNHEEEAVAGLL